MELLILLTIILLFFGAKRLPQLGRSLGSGLQEFRKVTAEADKDQDEVREGHRARRDRARMGLIMERYPAQSRRITPLPGRSLSS
jgi:sec-independent protein translocase protein TatA